MPLYLGGDSSVTEVNGFLLTEHIQSDIRPGDEIWGWAEGGVGQVYMLVRSA